MFSSREHTTYTVGDRDYSTLRKVPALYDPNKREAVIHGSVREQNQVLAMLLAHFKRIRPRQAENLFAFPATIHSTKAR